MNNIKKLSIYSFIIALFFSFSIMSCEGPEGPIGPQGAQGEQGVAGAQGPAGQDGQTGQNGQDGNANVKSYTFSVSPSEWTDVGTAGQAGAYSKVVVSVAAITQDIFDNGMVVAYLSFGGKWLALPVTLPFSASNSRTLGYLWGVGEFEYQVRNSDYSHGEFADTFRVLVIEGEAGKNSPNIDYTNYEEVAAYYGLNE